MFTMATISGSQGAVNKTLSLLDICDSTNNNNLWFVVLLLGLCCISCVILLAFMFHTCILRTTTCCCTWRACCPCCSATGDIEDQKSKSTTSWLVGGQKSKPKPAANAADLVISDYTTSDVIGGNEALQACTLPELMSATKTILRLFQFSCYRGSFEKSLHPS